jgi:hypothetical protein
MKIKIYGVAGLRWLKPPPGLTRVAGHPLILILIYFIFLKLWMRAFWKKKKKKEVKMVKLQILEV